MPITLEWLIPEHVMGLRWSGHVQDKDLDLLDKRLFKILEDSQQPLVHFISHELDLLSEPSFTKYARSRAGRHQRFGWYLIVQREQNFAARVITQLAGSMLRMRFRVMESEADAWAYLCHLYPHFEPRAMSKQSDFISQDSL